MALRLSTALFALFWIAMAVAPTSRADWLLENAMTVVGCALLYRFWRRGALSDASVVLGLVFLALHTVGAHYSYSLVPYDEWSKQLFGRSINETLGWQRNQYDRLVHFSFGVLLAMPCHDWLVRGRHVARGTAWWVTLLLAMSASHVYELIEWGAAEIFGGELGAAYVGAQGDEWDAQKDMALATLGTFIGIAIGLVIGWRTTRSALRSA